MKNLYIIVVKSSTGPTPIRFGVNGGGNVGYCLFCGEIVCFPSLKEARRALKTFFNPHLYTIIKYTKED